MTEHEQLMEKNLHMVFGERDAERRLAAIKEIYAEDAILFEPHAAAKGHAAISDAVSGLLNTLPSDFTFSAVGSAVSHHGAARLKWQSGQASGPVVATGIDVASFENGLIKTLHVFLDV